MKIAALLLIAIGGSIPVPAQSGSLNFDSKHPPEAVCRAAAPKLQEAGVSKLVLAITLSASGQVQSFKTESPKGLQLEKMKEAATAIRSLQFKPGIGKDGSPVAVQIAAEFDCAESVAYRAIPPKLIRGVAPIPPARSWSSGSGGRLVWIELTVQTDGVPKDLKVTKSVREELDESALDAVRQWRFQPATKDGKPIEAKIVVQVSFPP